MEKVGSGRGHRPLPCGRSRFWKMREVSIHDAVTGGAEAAPSDRGRPCAFESCLRGHLQMFQRAKSMVNCLLALFDFDPLCADKRLDSANSSGQVAEAVSDGIQFGCDI